MQGAGAGLPANHPGETRHAECTSRGHRVQSSRKRQKNDDIAEGAATRKRVMGKGNGGPRFAGGKAGAAEP